MTSCTSLPINISPSELHVIIREDMGIVFHAETLAFFKISIKTAHILKEIADGLSLTDCAARYELSVAEIETFLNSLQNEIAQQAETRPLKIDYTEFPGECLILLVSQDCNLRCRYCNAGGGDYGQGRGLMTPATAIQTIEKFIQNSTFLFRKVEFFGGEPTLNLPAIRAACQHLTQAYQDGRIVEMPWFTLITNGMLVNDEFVQLVKEYKIQVTLSIDGPQNLHDRYRVDLGGQGSYHRIVKGIEKLRQATNGQQPSAVEATVTRQHLDNGYNYLRLKQFFANELDIHYTHLMPIESGYDEIGGISSQERAQWLIDAQTSLIQDLVRGEPQASVLGLRLLKKLVFKRINPYLCPVGVGVLTVNANGEIYPCYQLMDPDFYMGDVGDENEVWKTAAYQKVVKRMRVNDKFQHEHCRLCWARGVCSACLGESYARTGSIEGRVDSYCAGIRGGVEEVLCGLAKLRNTPGDWQKVLASLKREYSDAGSATDLY